MARQACTTEGCLASSHREIWSRNCKSGEAVATPKLLDQGRTAHIWNQESITHASTLRFSGFRPSYARPRPKSVQSGHFRVRARARRAARGSRKWDDSLASRPRTHCQRGCRGFPASVAVPWSLRLELDGFDIELCCTRG
eukprot:SAG22_NODE_4746_length_1176_cov_1.390901_1_plen_140_part_00